MPCDAAVTQSMSVTTSLPPPHPSQSQPSRKHHSLGRDGAKCGVSMCPEDRSRYIGLLYTGSWLITDRSPLLYAAMTGDLCVNACMMFGAEAFISSTVQWRSFINIISYYYQDTVLMLLVFCMFCKISLLICCNWMKSSSFFFTKLS